MGSGLLKSLLRCIRGTARGRTSITGHWHHLDLGVADSMNVLSRQTRSEACISIYYTIHNFLWCAISGKQIWLKCHVCFVQNQNVVGKTLYALLKHVCPIKFKSWCNTQLGDQNSKAILAPGN